MWLFYRLDKNAKLSAQQALALQQSLTANVRTEEDFAGMNESALLGLRKREIPRHYEDPFTEDMGETVLSGAWSFYGGACHWKNKGLVDYVSQLKDGLDLEQQNLITGNSALNNLSMRTYAMSKIVRDSINRTLQFVTTNYTSKQYTKQLMDHIANIFLNAQATNAWEADTITYSAIKASCQSKRLSLHLVSPTQFREKRLRFTN